jgi:hypothetical protein
VTTLLGWLLLVWSLYAGSVGVACLAWVLWVIRARPRARVTAAELLERQATRDELVGRAGGAGMAGAAGCGPASAPAGARPKASQGRPKLSQAAAAGRGRR